MKSTMENFPVEAGSDWHLAHAAFHAAHAMADIQPTLPAATVDRVNRMLDAGGEFRIEMVLRKDRTQLVRLVAVKGLRRLLVRSLELGQGLPR